MRVFVALIVIFCLFLSAPVQAQAPAKFNRTAVAKEIALSVWGPVCNGEYVPIVKQETAFDGYAYYDDPDFDGKPPFTNCRVGLRVNVHWPWKKFCTIVVHEFGHLAGKKHVNNIYKVMNPYYTFPYHKCVNKPQANAPR